jgi:hypothetical protein
MISCSSLLHATEFVVARIWDMDVEEKLVSSRTGWMIR